MIEAARHRVATAANLTMVNLYWNIGRVITRDMQRNDKRAEYGSQLLERLAEYLTKEYGRGFSKINLQDMRRFYEHFQIDQTVSDLLALPGKIRRRLTNHPRRKPAPYLAVPSTVFLLTSRSILRSGGPLPSPSQPGRCPQAQFLL